MTRNDDHHAVELLNGLVRREWDALSALHAADEHLRDERDRVQTESFLSSHRAHIGDLDRLVLDRGGSPSAHGDFEEIVREGKVLLGAIAGEPAILLAMKSNTDVLVTAYRAASSDEALSSHERDVIVRLLAEEEWHAAWLEDRMGLSPDVGEAIMAPEGENERARDRAARDR
jgi:hypothetical protein